MIEYHKEIDALVAALEGDFETGKSDASSLALLVIYKALDLRLRAIQARIGNAYCDEKDQGDATPFVQVFGKPCGSK